MLISKESCRMLWQWDSPALQSTNQTSEKSLLVHFHHPAQTDVSQNLSHPRDQTSTASNHSRPAGTSWGSGRQSTCSTTAGRRWQPGSGRSTPTLTTRQCWGLTLWTGKWRAGSSSVTGQSLHSNLITVARQGTVTVTPVTMSDLKWLLSRLVTSSYQG